MSMLMLAIMHAELVVLFNVMSWQAYICSVHCIFHLSVTSAEVLWQYCIMLKDLSMIYRALWDGSHEGAIRISQCIVQINAGFSMRCRNHHSNTYANHVIIVCTQSVICTVILDCRLTCSYCVSVQSVICTVILDCRLTCSYCVSVQSVICTVILDCRLTCSYCVSVQSVICTVILDCRLTCSYCVSVQSVICTVILDCRLTCSYCVSVQSVICTVILDCRLTCSYCVSVQSVICTVILDCRLTCSYCVSVLCSVVLDSISLSYISCFVSACVLYSNWDLISK